MELVSIIFIYILFWVISAFIVLPIGIKNHQETGIEMVAGQADGAPVNLSPIARASIHYFMATILFGLFYLNYVNGWISIEDIDFFGSSERLAGGAE